MEEAVKKTKQTEQLKKSVLGWQENVKAQVGRAVMARMEELVKQVGIEMVAAADKEMGKQRARMQVKKMEALCWQMEEKAKEKVKLEREKAKGKDKSNNMKEFYAVMEEYDGIYEGLVEMEEEEKVVAKVIVT